MGSVDERRQCTGRRVGTTRIEALADGIFAAVFYNTRLALYLYFLFPVVHLLPGRVDMTERRPKMRAAADGNHPSQ